MHVRYSIKRNLVWIIRCLQQRQQLIISTGKVVIPVLLHHFQFNPLMILSLGIRYHIVVCMMILILVWWQ